MHSLYLQLGRTQLKMQIQIEIMLETESAPRYSLNTLKNCCSRICKPAHHDPKTLTMPDFTSKHL